MSAQELSLVVAGGDVAAAGRVGAWRGRGGGGRVVLPSVVVYRLLEVSVASLVDQGL